MEIGMPKYLTLTKEDREKYVAQPWPVEREQRIAEAKERIVDVARVWATGYSGGSFNLIDAVRELEEAEK